MSKTTKPAELPMGLTNEAEEELLETRPGQLVNPFVKQLLKKLKQITVPYGKMTEAQQASFITDISSMARGYAIDVLRIIEAAESPAFPCKMGNAFKIKDHELTVTLTLPTSDDAMLSMVKGSGREVYLVMDEGQIIDDRSEERAKPDPDEPELPVEEPPKHQPSDKELAAEGLDVPASRAVVH